jgi:LmeA-like phospholipid-binding
MTLWIRILFLSYSEGQSVFLPMPLHPDRSRLVSKMLSSAVRLWLRSQVESVQELHLQIEGGDRQILTGYIPKVAIAARQAVYRGIHLSQVDLAGENIRINLGQVLKGKPLKLLEVVPIQGNFALSEEDLNASLKTPLLANAVAELILQGWRSSLLSLLPLGETPITLQNCRAVIERDRVTLDLDWQSAAAPLSITLCTGLSLMSESRLKLEQPNVFVHQSSQSIQLEDDEIDLGTDVALQELTLSVGKMTGRGQINVLP